MAQPIKRRFDTWNGSSPTFPTFEEIKDIELVRSSGQVDMLKCEIIEELSARGLHTGAAWIKRCSTRGVSWMSQWNSAMNYYQTLHGPPSTWFAYDCSDSEQEIMREVSEISDDLDVYEKRTSAIYKKL